MSDQEKSLLIEEDGFVPSVPSTTMPLGTMKSDSMHIEWTPEEEEEMDRRMNVIGQNGNDGKAYEGEDPSGIPRNAPGAKLDKGKNRLSLVLNSFCRALTAVGYVGTYGANKYSDNGWLEVENAEQRYADAMLRHHFDEAMGQRFDPESGILHAAHRAWNALAVLELMLRNQMEGDKK